MLPSTVYNTREGEIILYRPIYLIKTLIRTHHSEVNYINSFEKLLQKMQILLHTLNYIYTYYMHLINNLCTYVI